jgi:CrcB protein
VTILRDVALVAAGGAAGCLARFGVSSVLHRIAFPWATLTVNLAGAFLLGASFLGSGMEHPTRMLVAVGFFGGFTTLSTYSVETIELWQEGRIPMAFANVALNGLGGPLAALLGWRLSVLIA